MSTDPSNLVDIGLSQAQMVAMAVPGAGMIAAAAISIFQAVYDQIAAQHTQQDYSVALAVSDLGREMEQLIADNETSQLLIQIKSWQRKINSFNLDTSTWDTTGKPEQATLAEAFFVNDDNYDLTFTALGDSNATDAEQDLVDGAKPLAGMTVTKDLVTQLPSYLLARSSYQALCYGALRYLARSQGMPPETGFVSVRSTIRTRFEGSLSEAIAHLTTLVDHLKDARDNNEAKAQALADASGGTHVQQVQVFSRELRRLNTETFLDQTTSKIIDNAASTIDAYKVTLASLQATPLPSNQGHAGGQGANQGQGGAAPAAGPTLGVRAPRTARFLFESGPTGFADNLGDSAIAAGSIATQNAGSNLGSIYYKVGGDGVNGIFAGVLQSSGQLDAVNDALATAYDVAYGTGSYAKDAAVRTDRLTSLLITIDQSPPVGSNVYWMVYTVGPHVGSSITDEPAYKQLYTDALTAISQWNSNKPVKIENFRITLVSCGLFATTPSAALNEQAARLVVDAVVDAMSTLPGIDTLQILVNTNPHKGDEARLAFSAAAKARGITAGLDGFDVALH